MPVDAPGEVIGVDMLRALSDGEPAEAAAEEGAEPQIGERLRVEPEGHASIGMRRAKIGAIGFLDTPAPEGVRPCHDRRNRRCAPSRGAFLVGRLGSAPGAAA